jgi:hypothetical protein
MKGQASWDYRPYSRLNEMHKREYPYISHIEPDRDSCTFEWFDNGNPEAKHSIQYQQRATDHPPVTIKAEGPEITLKGLKPDCEYEFSVFRTNEPEAKSDLRKFRTGYYPGKIVNYLHPRDDAYAFSGRCLATPGIVRTESGALLVSMDTFYHGTPSNLQFIFRSDNGGENWKYLCEIFPSFWGKLFCHRGRVYMLSVVNEYGDLQIGCSEDEGLHWGKPVTLFPGAGNGKDVGPHKSSSPVLYYKNRIWTAVEYGSWSRGYHESGVVSVSEDADLMKPENWSCTGFLRFNPEWEGASPKGGLNYIEGSVVAGPDGNIYNILRNNNNSIADGNLGKAVILKIDADNPEKKPEFCKIIDFNGGTTKFVVVKDEKTGIYYSIVNRVTGPSAINQRNIVSLAVSRDLLHWKIVKDLVDASDEAPEEVGLQYTDHIAVGEDLLFVTRTAYNHAWNFHDSNCITFHQEKNFRQLLAKV